MKITVEKILNKAGDKQTVRLVYWYGSYTENGKTKHNRQRETLDQFLYVNPKNRLEKQHNKEAEQLIEAIRAKRITEAASSQHGFADSTKEKVRFWWLFDHVMNSKVTAATSKTTRNHWRGCQLKLHEIWKDETLLLSQITEDDLKQVRQYFDTQAKTKTGQSIKKPTASAYWNKFRQVMKYAYDKGYIRTDLLADIKTISVGPSERTYLTIEEVRRLVETPCRYDVLKRAFLFSCLTGLRWSDVFKLDWSEFGELNGVHRITFKQKKTGGLQYLDITQQAFNLLGDPAKSGRVFYGLRYSTNSNVELLRWALSAGINKHVTFHAARHTFAVSLLSNGVDIYTVSKLMGHTQLKTTQIYSDIIDEVRKDAMHRIPDIGL